MTTPPDPLLASAKDDASLTGVSARTGRSSDAAARQTLHEMDAAGFLDAIFGDAVNAGSRISAYLLKSRRSILTADINEAVKFAAAGSKAGQDAYIGCGLYGLVSKGRGGARDVVALTALWMDVDLAKDKNDRSKPSTPEQAYESASCYLKPSIWVCSGGGFHAWWLFKEPIGPKEGAILSERWQAAINHWARVRHGWTFDKTHDLARVLRVPGTVNTKYPGAVVRVIDASLTRYEPCDFEEHFVAEATTPQNTAPTPLIDGPGEVPEAKLQALIDNNPKFAATWAHKRTDFGDNTPSSYDQSIANFCVTADMTDADVWAVILRFRTKHNLEPAKAMRRDYIERTIARARTAKDSEPVTRTKKPLDLTVLARQYIADKHTTTKGLTLRWWRGMFLQWTGRCYRGIPKDALRAKVLQWLYASGLKGTPRLAGDIAICAGALPDVMVDSDIEQPCFLDNPAKKVDFLAFENGLLDLADVAAGTAELFDHTPLWFSDMAVPYPFDEHADCPLWRKTLDEIFEGDKECIALLQEWFGYNLSSDTSRHKILFMSGPTRSGKGTVLRILRAVLGAHNCVSPMLSTLGELFGKSGLIGKRAAILGDCNLPRGEKGMAALEVLKTISGEDAIEIHRKNQASVTLQLCVRFSLAVNRLPQFGDGANALAARALMLPLTKSFLGREDEHRTEKLTAELPGILSWSLVGWRRLNARGRFTVPKVSAEILKGFERLTSPVKAWLLDECDVAPHLECPVDKAWQSWEEWCRKDGGRHPGNKELLGAELRSLGIDGFVRRQITIETKNGEKKRIPVYFGFGLQGAADIDASQAARAARAKPFL